MTLTQKETTLLQDLMSHEQLCIEKYGKYASDACDGQLKNLLTELGQVERQHLDTLNQIASGSVPNMNGASGASSSKPAVPEKPTYTSSDDPNMKKDKYLCQDLLSTEKHVSSVYDTCIFEFKDVGIRDALNHIQKEEQEHGQLIYSYMEKNGMYS